MRINLICRYTYKEGDKLCTVGPGEAELPDATAQSLVDRGLATAPEAEAKAAPKRKAKAADA